MGKTASKENSNPSNSSKSFFSKNREGGFFAQTKEAEQPFFASNISLQAATWGGNPHRTPFFQACSQPIIQPKLTINEPGDKYEQEADAMSERIMQMKVPVGESGDKSLMHPKALISNTINRKCTDCEQEEKVQRQEMYKEESHQAKPLMRKSSDDEGYTASPQLGSQLNSSKGGGNPLPTKTLNSMNYAFGADFSTVRTHTDSQAADMCQGIQAKAFTHGLDIYFNQGQYRLDSSNGKRLLAHELTHVRQQGKGVNNKLQRDSVADSVADPAWMSPSYKGLLPGEHIGGLGPFTEDDRKQLFQALKARTDTNRNNVAAFLRDYVGAAVDICGKFVSSEMSDTAKKAGLSTFGKLIKFALSETLQVIASGGMGVFAKPLLNKGVVSGLKFLADKSAGLTADQIGDKFEQNLLSDDIDKKQKAMDQITQRLGEVVGEFVFDMVSHLGEDVENLFFWLGNEPLSELWRFSIPELFPVADKKAIRLNIASTIASMAHAHYKCEPSGPGLQCGDPSGPINDFTTGSVQFFDDNIILVSFTLSAMTVEFFSASEVLTKEIVGKAPISSLPNLPIFIEYNASLSDDLGIATIIMNGVRGGKASKDEIEQFLAAFQVQKGFFKYDDHGLYSEESQRNYNTNANALAIKRDKKGDVSVFGGGLIQQAVLYALATGDTSFIALGQSLVEWIEGEDEHLRSPEAPPKDRTEQATPTQLGEKAGMWFPSYLEEGAKNLITKKLLSQTPKKPSRSRF